MIAWNILQESYVSGRIPSGIILNSVVEDKALAVAEKFAKLLLCQDSKDGISCGKCKSCCYMQQSSHPEVCYISKEDGSEFIKIEQVRSLISKLQQTPLYGSHKVMIISAAESIHEMAMNALLKTLEQPPGNATIILITTKLDSIPATIRSRCSCLNIAADEVTLQDLSEQNLSISADELALANFLADYNKTLVMDLVASDFGIYKSIVSCFLLHSTPISEAFDKDADVASIISYSHKLVILCIKIKQGCHPSFMESSSLFSDAYDIVNYNNIVSWYKLYDYHVTLQEELAAKIALNANTTLLELYSTWQIIMRKEHVN